MGIETLSAEDLQKKLSENEHLEGVPLEQLQWLISRGELRSYKAGDKVMDKNTPIEFLFIVLNGQIQLKKEQKGEYRIISELDEGDISGALPYSRAKSSMAVVQAKLNSQLFLLSKSHFKEMVQDAPELTEALVHVMTSRVRDFTHNQQQTEKLASLGRLSAGLHHELNNPAAAALRAATELKEKLQLAPEKFKNLLLIHLDEEKAEQLAELVFSSKQQQAPKKLSLLERSGLEDEMTNWLEEKGIEDASAMSETFCESGIDLEKLQKLDELSGNQQFTALIDWLYHLLSTDKLVSDIQESTRRISALVGAVKNYSHMDRSPEKELTDLEASIRNTLTILNFKLRNKKIKAEVEANGDVPQMCVYAGELNQVWTNLIDNAIDAMEEGGRLSIQLQKAEGGVIVSVKDNGSGIPGDLRDRIFDPFYTTKGIGEGSGMGLDIVKKIIERHGGNIEVNSKPGETEFRIFIPETA